MTDDLVARLRAAVQRYRELDAAATPGPWRVNDEQFPEYILNEDCVTAVAGARWGGEGSVFNDPADAHLIAASRVLPRLVADLIETALADYDRVAPLLEGAEVSGIVWHQSQSAIWRRLRALEPLAVVLDD